MVPKAAHLRCRLQEPHGRFVGPFVQPRLTKRSLEVERISEVRQESVKDRPFGGCIARSDVVASGVTAPHGRVGKGVQEMHLLQLEHRTSVEHVAQTVMEQYL